MIALMVRARLYSLVAYHDCTFKVKEGLTMQRYYTLTSATKNKAQGGCTTKSRNLLLYGFFHIRNSSNTLILKENFKNLLRCKVVGDQ